MHLAVVLFGAAGLFGRWVPLPPTTLVLGRVVFASAALGALRVARRGRDRGDATGSDATARRSTDRWLLPLLGILLAAHWVSFFHAIQLSSVAVGLLTFATFPVFTALLEPVLPGQRLDPATVLAAAATVVGVALVVPSADPGDPVARGAFWGVVSGATFALLSVANRGLVRRRGALTLAFHQDLWAAVALLPFAAGPLAPDGGRAPTGAEWGLLVLLGVVFTAGAHALFINGLRGVTAGRAAVVAALEPVYGVALAALLLGERPGGEVLLGGGIVLAAAAWVGRRRDPAEEVRAADRTPSRTAPSPRTTDRP